MTYEEVCTRILFEAQRGGEKAELANLNTQSVIESIMPSVLQDVAQRCAGDPQRQSLLRQTHTVTLASGVGTLPAEVLTSCIWGSTVWVADENDVGPRMSFTPWVSFINPADDRLGYYSVRGDHEFYWADPGESYPDLTRTGDVQYTGATTPTVPANATDETGWGAEIESDVIDRAAEYLRGVALVT